ncbi:hypothetical protein BJ165DRAFT_1352265 [Panaeolus papilionaceus]|nr:hypothetical protein BJ165DRAFT_1352265 [Panaeolus papilionaceus]
MIIFYDIPSTLPGSAWTPNTWKTRYTLNYKGIPYKTEWIEYPDIEAHCKALSISPTMKKEDGSDYYTLPAIWDTSTGAKVSDSFAILQYLEKTYPERPTLFPDNTKALHFVFQVALRSTDISAVVPFLIPAEGAKLNPRSKEYFYRTRSERFGKPLEDTTPTGEEGEKQWAKFKAGLDTINDWYEMTDDGGPFMMGNKLGWSDVFLASQLTWAKVVWQGEPQWQEISSWNGGRWAKLLEAMKPYSQVV